MSKKVLVLLADGFEDVEAVTAVDVLRRAEVEVTTAGLGVGLVRGARGVSVQPDATLAEAAKKDFDAVVLPGGAKGAENLAASAAVRELVLDYWKKGKVVAAICAAPGVVLAPLGVLDGKRAAGFPGTEKNFPASAAYADGGSATDGNLVTGRAMGASLEFSLALVEKLSGPEAAEKVCLAVLP